MTDFALKTPVHALQAALERRAALLLSLGEQTTCVRLLHGAVEGCPGLTVDRYGSTLLVQTWREPLSAETLDGLHATACDALGLPLRLVWNHRAKAAPPYEQTFSVAPRSANVGLELGLRFDTRVRHRGRDPLLFLDFRAARRLLRAESSGCTVLNTFSYTCGIGVAAAAGGARSVLNLDFAESALTVGQTNAALNEVGAVCSTLQVDCLPALRQLSGQRQRQRRGRVFRAPAGLGAARQFDRVILDPPRWATGKWGAVDLVRDYQSLFKPAVLITAPGGYLLATNNVASVSVDDWLPMLRRCAKKAGRPVKSLDLIAPESDFPSSDGRSPLKMAWIGL